MDSGINIVHQKPYVDIQSVQMCLQWIESHDTLYGRIGVSKVN